MNFKEPVFTVTCTKCSGLFAVASCEDHSKRSLGRYHDRRGPVDVKYVSAGSEVQLGTCGCPRRSA